MYSPPPPPLNNECSWSEEFLENNEATPMAKELVVQAFATGDIATLKAALKGIPVFLRATHYLDISNGTLLHTAAKHGQLEVTKFLVDEVHYSVEMLDYNSRTPCHVAAEHGHLDIVRFICNHSGPIIEQNVPIADKKDAHKNTALHLASQAGHMEVVQYLMEEQKCKFHNNKDGDTAIDVAAKNGKNAICLSKKIQRRKGSCTLCKNRTLRLSCLHTCNLS